jgi:3-deoxy-D-arabino-heptulosonate 7-phosphate (DAHP) synthase class II
MHGNTKIFESKGKKIRYFDDVKMEILQTINTLNENSFNLNGLHLEASCEEVTECIGGIENIVGEDEIEKNYSTYCDPRLNFEQALELSHLIASVLVKGKNDSCSTDITD